MRRDKGLLRGRTFEVRDRGGQWQLIVIIIIVVVIVVHASVAWIRGIVLGHGRAIRRHSVGIFHARHDSFSGKGIEPLSGVEGAIFHHDNARSSSSSNGGGWLRLVYPRRRRRQSRYWI